MSVMTTWDFFFKSHTFFNTSYKFLIFKDEAVKLVTDNLDKAMDYEYGDRKVNKLNGLLLKIGYLLNLCLMSNFVSFFSRAILISEKNLTLK